MDGFTVFLLVFAILLLAGFSGFVIYHLYYRSNKCVKVTQEASHKK